MPRPRSAAAALSEPETLNPDDVGGVAVQASLLEDHEPKEPRKRVSVPAIAPPEASEARATVQPISDSGEPVGEPQRFPVSELAQDFRDRSKRRTWLRAVAGPGRYLCTLEQADGTPLPGTVPWVDVIPAATPRAAAGTDAAAMPAAMPAAATVATPAGLDVLRFLSAGSPPEGGGVDKLMTFMMRESKERQEREDRDRDERRREESERKEREDRDRKDRDAKERQDREDRRREEREARERDERRADQRMQTMVSLAGLALPLVTKMLDRPAPANDTGTLLNLVTNIMQKTTEQQMDASSRLIEMTMQKAEKAANMEPAKPSAWDKVFDLAGAALPMLAQMHASEQQASQPQAIPAKVVHVHHPPEPVNAPTATKEPAMPTTIAPTPTTPAPVPVLDLSILCAEVEMPADAQGLRRALYALRGLHTYELDEAEQAMLLRHAIDALPAELQDAIAADQVDTLMQVGQSIVMADPALLTWLAMREGAAHVKANLPAVAQLIRDMRQQAKGAA